MVLSGIHGQGSAGVAPVASASADLRGALPGAMRLTWDFGMAPASPATHVLCVEIGRFSLLFQVEPETLSERGEAYARFMQKVIRAVREHFPPERAALQ
jgi:hypothetical protein